MHALQGIDSPTAPGRLGIAADDHHHPPQPLLPRVCPSQPQACCAWFWVQGDELHALLEETPSAGLNVYLEECNTIQGPDFVSLWVYNATQGLLNAGGWLGRHGGTVPAALAAQGLGMAASLPQRGGMP